MWITPLRDGLNLVDKEFVAVQGLTGVLGVLVLSEFAGAAAELKGAVLTNPVNSLLGTVGGLLDSLTTLRWGSGTGSLEQARGSFETAKFYEKRKKWEAARIYYNDVLNKDPGSSYADEARVRIASEAARYQGLNLAAETQRKLNMLRLGLTLPAPQREGAAALVGIAAASSDAPSDADRAAQVERGKYLVTVAVCNDCHTPFKMGENGPELFTHFLLVVTIAGVFLAVYLRERRSRRSRDHEQS